MGFIIADFQCFNARNMLIEKTKAKQTGTAFIALHPDIKNYSNSNNKTQAF